MPETAVVFERALDHALNSQQVLDALVRAKGVADREQLRTRAVRARAAITAAAAVEYQEYLRARSAVEGANREPVARVVPGWSAARAALRWVAAKRDRAGAGDVPADDVPDVTRAREAWELALLERGVVPFLLGRLEELLMGQRGGRAAR
ncbi:hypothetical protein BEK98_08215 [Streptomyces diastatochromogenes]|uniref:Uncharacterized protein n=1 Tax=Streptomyces diastatochromogenes TaxID=42236 RepID=A0A233SPG8_STRDA|nr:hypothetical protein BEK98_08215 [Streptomyces diastatochromogenes]